MEDNCTWDMKSKTHIKTPEEMKKFFEEINEVCKKHNLSISHEDQHGAFIIENYNKDNIEWLEWAMKSY